MKVRGQIVVSSDTREPCSLESETLFDHFVELITKADLVTGGLATLTSRQPSFWAQPS